MPLPLLSFAALMVIVVITTIIMTAGDWPLLADTSAPILTLLGVSGASAWTLASRLRSAITIDRGERRDGI